MRRRFPPRAAAGRGAKPGIGRGAWRGRGENLVVAGSFKKKKDNESRVVLVIIDIYLTAVDFAFICRHTVVVLSVSIYVFYSRVISESLNINFEESLTLCML